MGIQNKETTVFILQAAAARCPTTGLIGIFFITHSKQIRSVGMRRAIGSIPSVSSWNARQLKPNHCQCVPLRRQLVVMDRHHRPTGSRALWSMLPSFLSSSSTSTSSTSTTDAAQNASTSLSEKTFIQMPDRREANTTTPKEQDSNREIFNLLNSPNGAPMDPSTWLKAEAAAQEAAEEGDFNLVFEIIDRMAKDPNAQTEMNNEFLHTIIQQWVFVYDRHQKSPKGTNHSHYIHSPSSVWRRLDSYLENGIQLDSWIIHRVLDSTALIRSKTINGPMLAETILERMISLSKQKNPIIRPSSYTFNAVLAAWEAAAAQPWSQTFRMPDAPERCLALLERLKALHAAYGDDELLPDKTTYKRVMNMFAQRGDGDKVESLMQELYESYRERGLMVLMPSSALFSLVLYAWSKSKDPDAAKRAATLLDQMLDIERKQTFPGLKVSAFCFNSVMVCWSKQRTIESAQKAQDLFDSMLALSASDPNKRPNPGSFATLVATWSLLDPKKAEEALWMWKREQNAGTCDLRMDNRLFSTLMTGWFYSNDPNSAKRCDKLLQYGLDGNFGEFWKPMVADFNMTINAYCRTTTNVQDVERAESLLANMKDLAQSSRDFRGPTLSSYTPLIHSLSRLGRVERAETLLREWYESENSLLEESPEDSIDMAHRKKNLNTKTFNRVLQAWLAKAPASHDAADRAEDLLLRMHDWGIKPNIASFQYTLECRRRIDKELEGLRQKPDMVPRVNRILALLDSTYKSGTMNADESSYVIMRRDWALLTV